MFTLRSSRNLNVAIPALDGVTATAYFGYDNGALQPVEVLLLEDMPSVTPAEIRAVQNWRSAKQSRRVVVCSTDAGRATIFGPVDDRQPISLSAVAAERLLQRFLDDQNPISATRELLSYYDSHGTSELGGVKNKGLFASHHIRENLPQRSDWSTLASEGQMLATKRYRELIGALGFSISREDRSALLLNASSSENRAVALLLEENENFDSPGGRFPTGPVSWGLAIAAENNIPWLIVLRKDQIRLHPGRDGVGVGQKGQAETYFELNLAQVDDSHLALLPLVFSADALGRGGYVQQLLDESSRYAVSLGARLRERIYEQVVPGISIAIAKQLADRGLKLDSEGLARAYSVTLRILFRLLFQAYAEDRGLLPAGRNEGYDANSLKTLAKRDLAASADEFGDVINIWHDLQQVWDAIDEGNPRWQVPPYNGGLFGRDPIKHQEGALIKTLELTDTVLGPALQALLVDLTEDGVRGPVDFRSLSVREFGTIYEGLLESSLSLAEVDLTVDSLNTWVPAKRDEEILVKAGEPYFHSASGERKATGSYFTPKVIVDHLVEKAIDPTLEKHLERIRCLIRSGDQSSASREFFNFRVADLAMGSAHFLVAAVDRIESKMRTFLANPANSVPGVTDEITRLRAAAMLSLGSDELAAADIEDSSLLRRQIARRCVYGIDINQMAVELSRLALWIHTFVPGLPMSSLDHNLVCANSLTGMGSIDEALDALIPGRGSNPTVFDNAITEGLEKAKALLIDAASASEANKSEVASGALLAAAAREAAESSRLFFNAALAARMGIVSPSTLYSQESILEAGLREDVIELAHSLKPAHMPYLFPEVFLRENGGFDALIGNPPWEELTLEEPRFWLRYRPGLYSLPASALKAEIKRLRSSHPERVVNFELETSTIKTIRKALLSGPFPGLGKGDVDLYQVFSWRVWQLLRKGGIFGQVFPRSILNGAGSSAWRASVASSGNVEVTVLTNSANWVFDNVDGRYSVCLVNSEKRDGHSGQISLQGPFFGLAEWQEMANEYSTMTFQQLKESSETLALPNLPSPAALGVVLKMQEQPRLAATRAGATFKPVREFDATLDRPVFDSTDSGGKVPVYGGSSFNLWTPSTGITYASADWDKCVSALQDRRSRQVNLKTSAFYQLPREIWMDPETLPCFQPRIVFRDVTNATNSRTMICSLIPGGVFLTNKAPYLFSRHGSPLETAFVLGILSSIPLDWYCRRYVELGMNLHVVNALPIPDPSISSALYRRVATLSASLVSVDNRLSDWALRTGLDTKPPSNDDEQYEMMAELDGLAAVLFGLTSEQLGTVFSSFHRGWSFEARLERALSYFRAWGGK